MTTVANNYAFYLKASEIAKGEQHHVFNWNERWPNFSANELCCKHCGDLLINYKALDALQSLRSMWRRPITVASAFRCPFHNGKVGGAPKSKHITGQAFDIRTGQYADSAVVALIYYATKAGFQGFGLYLDRPTPFIHIDTGSPRTWQSGQSRLDDTDDVTEILPQ